MKRIDIRYGGEQYSVGDRDFDELREEIVQGVTSGGRWLNVNDGEGTRRDAQLLLHPGVPITLIPITPEPAQEGDPG
jgi:hypothetical protein